MQILSSYLNSSILQSEKEETYDAYNFHRSFLFCLHITSLLFHFIFRRREIRVWKTYTLNLLCLSFCRYLFVHFFYFTVLKLIWNIWWSLLRMSFSFRANANINTNDYSEVYVAEVRRLLTGYNRSTLAREMNYFASVKKVIPYMWPNFNIVYRLFAQ